MSVPNPSLVKEKERALLAAVEALKKDFLEQQDKIIKENNKYLKQIDHKEVEIENKKKELLTSKTELESFSKKENLVKEKARINVLKGDVAQRLPTELEKLKKERTQLSKNLIKRKEKIAHIGAAFESIIKTHEKSGKQELNIAEMQKHSERLKAALENLGEDDLYPHAGNCNKAIEEYLAALAASSQLNTDAESSKASTSEKSPEPISKDSETPKIIVQSSSPEPHKTISNNSAKPKIIVQSFSEKSPGLIIKETPGKTMLTSLTNANNSLNSLKNTSLSSVNNTGKTELLGGVGNKKNKDQQTWVPFLKQDVREKLLYEKGHQVLVSISADITPEKFKEICGKLQEKVTNYPNESREKEEFFKRLEVKESAQHKDDPNHTHYNIYKDKGSESKPMVKLSHVPEQNKINIVLTDFQAQDQALFLMVVSAKSLLEEMGSNRFHIEHCEDKPEIALKLYLIGKSLGLDPVFKDKPGQEGKTERSITGSEIKLKIEDGSENTHTLGAVYAAVERENLNNDRLKEFIHQLKIEKKEVKEKPSHRGPGQNFP